jgi:hypothetical protein
MNFEKILTEHNGPHFIEIEKFEFKSRFEFQSLLESLQYVFNIIMWIRDTGCYNLLASAQ